MAARLFDEYLAGRIIPTVFLLVVVQRCIGADSLRTVTREGSLPVNAALLGAEAVLLSREARRDALPEFRGILALLDTLSSLE